ncbi:MAG: YdcF family protein, partial [Candidatus Puniceispirillales bacterium]
FLILMSFIILLVSTNTFVSNYLFKKLEYPYIPISIDSINKSDAIVILSGMIHQVGHKNNFKYEWSDPDRFFGGLELLKKNKSDLLIFTAGQLPWTNNWKPEGLILKNKAIELGVVENKILITENVKNTYEESLKVLKLIPKGSSIILVTSAFHMQRSKYLFEKQGFKVNPFPVDFKTFNTKLTFLDIIPSVGALKKTSIFIRENIGRFYYKIIFQLT